MVPMGTHEWKQYLNYEDVEAMISGQAKVVAKAGVMITNPITLEMEEFPNWLRGNYMLMARKL